MVKAGWLQDDEDMMALVARQEVRPIQGGGVAVERDPGQAVHQSGVVDRLRAAEGLDVVVGVLLIRPRVDSGPVRAWGDPSILPLARVFEPLGETGWIRIRPGHQVTSVSTMPAGWKERRNRYTWPRMNIIVVTGRSFRLGLLVRGEGGGSCRFRLLGSQTGPDHKRGFLTLRQTNPERPDAIRERSQRWTA